MTIDPASDEDRRLQGRTADTPPGPLARPARDSSAGPSSDGSVGWVILLDGAAKAVLVLLLVLTALDPAWGNLEGKAPVARAVTYPLWSFALPLWWLLRRPRSAFPWVADLLVTLTCFTDILGNRLDLYDTVVWFDDWMHLMNTCLLSAAVVLVTTGPRTGLAASIERGLALTMTAALAWELFEYVSFVTRSKERATAYADTVDDLVLGWIGALVGAVAVALWRSRRHRPA